MGRDWKYYWGGGGGRTTKSTNHNHGIDSPSAATGCCINAVLHLFDFQSSNFSCHNHHQQQQQPSISNIKGAEAPRNSLEIDPPMAMAMEAFSNIPVGIQIKTHDQSSRTGDLSSECSSSPALKTPNLVARLMGLDLLPDPDQTNIVPDLSSSNKSLQTINNKFILDIDFMGSRSLPETPRISTERRSNLQDCHRLSLQINRENKVSGPMAEQFQQYRNSTGRRDVCVLDEENISPGFYARRILKKVKDNIIVTRKFGSDITNTVNNNHQKQRIHDKDQILLSKPNKQGIRSISDESASSSGSPRLRFLELKNRGVNTGKVHNSKQKHQSLSEQKCGGIRKEIKRDQVLNSRSSESIKNKKVETFKKEKFPTFKKCKKTPAFKKYKKSPLSSELLCMSNVSKLSYLKKNPVYQLPAKQEYDDGPSSERRVTVQERSSGTIGINRLITEKWTAVINSIEKTVLDRLEPGIMSYQSSLRLFDTSASSSSSSLPNMSLRCNRLLIFDLVNEFLELEFSRKELGLDKDRVLLTGPDLVRTVCHKIKNFPAADCRVVKDIDAIIESDLQGGGGRKLAMVEEEEREGITEEIEGELLDKLVKETTTLLYYGYN